MSNNKITSATKDLIKRYYRDKTSTLSKEKEEIRDALDKIISCEIHRNPKYLEYKKQTLEFEKFINSDDTLECVSSYSFGNVVNKIRNDDFFVVKDILISKIINEELNFIKYTEETKELIHKYKYLANQINLLNNERDKIIFILETASTKTPEYKEAYNKVLNEILL